MNFTQALIIINISLSSFLNSPHPKPTTPQTTATTTVPASPVVTPGKVDPGSIAPSAGAIRATP